VTLADAYRRELARHGWQADAAQAAAIAHLDELRARLRRAARREARWPWRLRHALSLVPARRAVTGIYLWGGVGRGKTLLLDLFASSLAVPVQRTHFHRYMHAVHQRLRRLRDLSTPAPLEQIAAEQAHAARVLCFDELYVDDIADAMLLAGLFTGLVTHGVTLVFTSNLPPAGLYQDGLQRARFLPAIALLERCTRVLEVDGGTDYRLRQLERAPLYVDTHAEDGELLLRQRFEAIAGGGGTEGGVLEVAARPIAVRRRAAGVVWFDFAALCTGPRGTDDYIELARQHHTVVISGVPVFGAGSEDEDAARRFIALVDEFYARGVKLVLSAATAPDRLYQGARLGLEFRRTSSRLTEMQSRAYLARPHRA
jgi:cell division protein ZapE